MVAWGSSFLVYRNVNGNGTSGLQTENMEANMKANMEVVDCFAVAFDTG